MLSEEQLEELYNIMPDACLNFLDYWKRKQDEYDNLPWYKRLFKNNPHYFKVNIAGTNKIHSKLSAWYYMLVHIQENLESNTYLITEEDYQFVKYWSNYA